MCTRDKIMSFVRLFISVRRWPQKLPDLEIQASDWLVNVVKVLKTVKICCPIASKCLIPAMMATSCVFLLATPIDHTSNTMCSFNCACSNSIIIGKDHRACSDCAHGVHAPENSTCVCVYKKIEPSYTH